MLWSIRGLEDNDSSYPIRGAAVEKSEQEEKVMLLMHHWTSREAEIAYKDSKSGMYDELFLQLLKEAEKMEVRYEELSVRFERFEKSEEVKKVKRKQCVTM